MIVCWLLRSWKEDKTAGIIISPGYVFLEQTTILEVESDTIVRALSKFCRSLRRNKCNPWSQVYLSRQSATVAVSFVAVAIIVQASVWLVRVMSNQVNVRRRETERQEANRLQSHAYLEQLEEAEVS